MRNIRQIIYTVLIFLGRKIWYHFIVREDKKCHETNFHFLNLTASLQQDNASFLSSQIKAQTGKQEKKRKDFSGNLTASTFREAHYHIITIQTPPFCSTYLCIHLTELFPRRLKKPDFKLRFMQSAFRKCLTKQDIANRIFLTHLIQVKRSKPRWCQCILEWKTSSYE